MELVRVICLIPSMTETLIECGVNVVGRTRYCIHPEQKVKAIPVVGGTKKIHTAELMAQKPDLILLDKEENTKEMADLISSLGCQMHVIHINSLSGLAQELLELSVIFKETKLQELAERLENILQRRGREDFRRRLLDLSRIQVSESQLQGHLILPQKLNYVIWKKPWMLIGRGTFIHDVLNFAGFELAHDLKDKYPKVADLDAGAVHLFSSEPYPFSREWGYLSKQYPQSLLVDGEKISWFGIRNLRFLQTVVDL